MSSLLKDAIVDAKALRESALKTPRLLSLKSILMKLNKLSTNFWNKMS
jgi:hypothetical protein